MWPRVKPQQRIKPIYSGPDKQKISQLQHDKVSLGIRAELNVL